MDAAGCAPTRLLNDVACLLQCMRPALARQKPNGRVARCPQFGVDRTPARRPPWLQKSGTIQLTSAVCCREWDVGMAHGKHWLGSNYNGRRKGKARRHLPGNQCAKPGPGLSLNVTAPRKARHATLLFSPHQWQTST